MEESEKVYIYTYNYIYIGAVCAVLSHVLRLFVTLWIIVHQAPLSMGFSRQEYWSGLPFPPPGSLPDPGCVEAACRLSLVAEIGVGFTF